VVLDLRYTQGNDYAAAAAVVDLFISKQKPLLDWGSGIVSSKSKNDAISLPVAVLVNHETKAAAEALAGVLRAAGAGLILGGNTAGEAMIAKEFPMKNGQVLRIATGAMELGDGTNLSTNGVKPDIAVAVNPEDERAYYADAFRTVSKSNLTAESSSATNLFAGTNRVSRRSRFNEAELVRERREGLRSEADAVAEGMRDEPDQPIVHDPVLSRAIDVLKGLAVVRAARS
jgi:C-terminal processing protease CtpA/Prc